MLSSSSAVLSPTVTPATHRLRRVMLCLSATLVVAIAAHLAFPLPFTPVPFTLQPLAVLGVGLALGPGYGCLAMLAYLLEGAAGLPVFAPTGLGGLAQLLGPTGGYLMAYPLVAWVAGFGTRLLGRKFSPFFAALCACLAAVACLFTAGAGWLAYAMHLSLHGGWIAGVAPFLPGEAIKALAAAGTYRALKRPARP